MGACELECSDVFDQRRFYSETIALLRALLASTATTDTEIEILYDVQGDGSYVPFYRYITIECDGEVVITDFEMDGTTPYTPTGTPTPVAPPVSQTVVQHNASVTGTILVPGSSTIPADFIHASIAVVDGTADIDGVTYPQSSSLCLPPMSFNGIDRLYPALPITNITGEVLINYYTKV